MNKYIFFENIYEDIDLFNNIKNEYNIELYESNIYTKIYYIKLFIKNRYK